MPNSSKDRRAVWLLFAIAAAVRVAWVCLQWSRHGAALQYPDEEAYLTVGRSLASGHGLVDEFGFRGTYMPAYPAFIALFSKSLLTVKLVQAVLAAWVAPGTFLLARVFKRDDRAATGAGLLVAFDPFLIFFSELLLTEALFAAVLVTAWMLVLNRSMVWAGVLLWLCVMLRPASIVLVPALLLVQHNRASVVILLIVLLGLFPWAVRNRITIGEWRWLTTRGGISLYDGVREGATGESDLAHTKTLPEVKDMSETQWDRYWQSQAYHAIAADPWRVLELGWKKIKRTWALTPNVSAYRQGAATTVSAVYMLVMLVTALIGIVKYRREGRRLVLLLLPVIVMTLLHMVYVGSVRYRVPVMPMLAVLSGAGLAYQRTPTERRN